MFQFIIFIVIAIATGVFLQQASPEVSFTYNATLIKIDMWKIVSVILIILLLQKWLLKLAIKNWLKILNFNKSLKYLKKTFFALLSGDIINAESYAVKLDNNNNKKINWLTMLFGLMKSELYYNQHNHEYALIELKKLYLQSPNNKLILFRLSAIYHALNNWEELLKLLPIFRKNKVYESSNFLQLEITIYTEYLKGLSSPERLGLAVNFFKTAPKHIKQQPLFVLSLVNILLLNKNYDLAENTVKNYINDQIKNLDIDDININNLLKIYGLINSSDIKQQIKTAECWHARNLRSASLLLTLGRLCIKEGLWGKAKHYLEQAILIQPDSECYKELGKLAELLGETEKSLQFYQKSLSLYK